ncbi:MAG TPA: dihydrodipicolinate reductase C-terminal domain-containing protein [Gaiellales bacterium]|jgi:4-hydroxy-tetrahydrodipicolinate reductase|nr:dihydrodipicolinate reductase C-terminal domain-containing protein [Gaiellales bacterium]
MLRVVISGATGAVGRALVPAVEAEPDLELAAQAAPTLGTSLAEALATANADVAVDFTAPVAAAAAWEAAVAARVPLVTGTTGLTPDDRERLGAKAWEAGVPILFAPNFAIGAVLMMRFAEQARPHMDAVEIVELHADTKRDAPSGTALATAARLGGDIPIHSIRLPGLVAHQEVILGARGQTLSLRHDTTSREAFVPGILLAIRRVGDLSPGLTTGLEAIL